MYEIHIFTEPINPRRRTVSDETKRPATPTPGPWRPRDYPNNDGDIWIDCWASGPRGKSQGGTLAVALHTGCGQGDMHANARLLAASPDLLAACQAAEQCITDLVEVYGRGCSMLVLDEAVKSLRDDALKLIVKAIAKTKEQPHA